MLLHMNAPTRMDAVSFKGGRTFYSRFGFDVDGNKDSESKELQMLCTYGPRSQRAELLRCIVLLVMD